MPDPAPPAAVRTPQPRTFPRCRWCKQPYALRRPSNLISLRTMKRLDKWTWLRDCERSCVRAHPRPIVKMENAK